MHLSLNEVTLAAHNAMTKTKKNPTSTAQKVNLPFQLIRVKRVYGITIVTVKTWKLYLPEKCAE